MLKPGVVLKYVVLSILYSILWILSLSVGSYIFSVEQIQNSGLNTHQLLALVVVSFINTLPLFLLTSRSRISRRKTFLLIFTVLFGIKYFLSQIETLFFNESLNLPIELILSLLFSGFLLSFLFSYALINIVTRPKKEKLISINISIGEKWKNYLVLVTVVYPVLYFSAGYFIAWQSPEVRMLYSGNTTILPFLEHMRILLIENVFIYPFQVVRATIWLLIGLAISYSISGSKYFRAIFVGIVFSLIMNSQHLLFNPYMPRIVSLYHFVETASSNFIWGVLVVLVGDSSRTIKSRSSV